MGIDAIKKQCRDIQDASNLSGVLVAWQKATHEIRLDAERMGIRWETHPANILYLSKVTSLMRVDSNCIGAVNRGEDDLFRTAWDWACGRLP